MLPRDLQFLGYDDSSGPGIYQGGAAVSRLILPGRNKEFTIETSFGTELSDFWGHLWSQAHDALGACSRIVVCGYSLPAADQRARELLFNAPLRDTTIEVVSGRDSERIASEFMSTGFSNVSTFGRGHFEDWLESACEAQ